MNNPRTFSACKIIKNAWSQLKGAKWPIWLPQLTNIAILFGMAIVLLISEHMAVKSGGMHPTILESIIQLGTLFGMFFFAPPPNGWHTDGRPKAGTG